MRELDPNQCVQATPDCALLFTVAQVSGAPALALQFMPKRTLAVTLGLLSAIAIIVFFAFLGGCLGSSGRRITREHGLVLPASASHFVCKGDAWVAIMDRGAASAFQCASNDVPSFVAQLKIKDTHHGDRGPKFSNSIFPGNPQYQVRTPWMSGIPLETYHCTSPVGDFLDVQIWPIDATHVGVCLYTDWN